MIFFPSCFNSEAKGPQPAKSHRSSLAKPQKAWPPLLCSLCLPFSSYVLQYVPLSLSICMSIYLLSYVSFLHVCLYWSVCLFVSFSPLFLVLFSSNRHTQMHTNTQTHTRTTLSPCLTVCHSQRTGLAGGVQLGSTNTWHSICLLVCAGMVFLSLCCLKLSV